MIRRLPHLECFVFESLQCEGFNADTSGLPHLEGFVSESL